MIQKYGNTFRILDDYWFHVLKEGFETKEEALKYEDELLKKRFLNEKYWKDVSIRDVPSGN